MVHRIWLEFLEKNFSAVCLIGGWMVHRIWLEFLEKNFSDS